MSSTTTTTTTTTATTQPSSTFQPIHNANTNSTSDSPILSSLQRNGYVLIPSILPPSSLETLRSRCAHLTRLARTGAWPHIRTVPKQFPPWPSTPPPPSSGGIWGVQHLLHPSCPGREDFARLYFSDAVLSPVKEILGLCSRADDDDDDDGQNEGDSLIIDPYRGDESLVMELFNLLVSPTGDVPFELKWHRDDLDIYDPRFANPDEESRKIREATGPLCRQMHAQYNIALYDDESLIVVPGSHRRARTEAERNVGAYDAVMPGAEVVRLKAGDAVFYDSNILHRGVYRGIAGDGLGIDPDEEEPQQQQQRRRRRYTLHGSVGLREDVDVDVDGGGDVRREGEEGPAGGRAKATRARARVVLQHGVGEWAGTQGFKGYFENERAGERLEKRAEGMRERLVAMGTWEGDYSLDG